LARYTEAVCKLCRREGEKLFLKGTRCTSPKCAFDRRPFPPGQHGRDTSFKRGRNSDYNAQLREKQKARRIYGILERQFRRYFAEAVRTPGMTGVNLLILLESRLDNVIYRLGIASSRAQARQLVQHGHFDINGESVDLPSYLIKAGDTITLHMGSANTKYFQDVFLTMKNNPKPPEWLTVEPKNELTCRATRRPERMDINLPLNEQLIVEYYSR
jgi:small subunit ribosomal protein S4